MPRLATYTFSADFMWKLKVISTKNILKEHNSLVLEFEMQKKKIEPEKFEAAFKAYRAAHIEQASFLKKNQKHLNFLMRKNEQLINLDEQQKDAKFRLRKSILELKVNYFSSSFAIASVLIALVGITLVSPFFFIPLVIGSILLAAIIKKIDTDKKSKNEASDKLNKIETSVSNLVSEINDCNSENLESTASLKPGTPEKSNSELNKATNKELSFFNKESSSTLTEDSSSISETNKPC